MSTATKPDSLLNTNDIEFAVRVAIIIDDWDNPPINAPCIVPNTTSPKAMSVFPTVNSAEVAASATAACNCPCTENLLNPSAEPKWAASTDAKTDDLKLTPETIKFDAVTCVEFNVGALITDADNVGSIPTEVMFVWAAVAIVPTIELPVIVPLELILPEDVILPAITKCEAMSTAPSMSTTSKLVVPSTSKSPLKSTLPEAEI